MSEPVATIWLPSHVHAMRIEGPAVVHMDRVTHMTNCHFDRCTLMYRGEKMGSLLEWMKKAGFA